MPTYKHQLSQSQLLPTRQTLKNGLQMRFFFCSCHERRRTTDDFLSPGNRATGGSAAAVCLVSVASVT